MASNLWVETTKLAYLTFIRRTGIEKNGLEDCKANVKINLNGSMGLVPIDHLLLTECSNHVSNLYHLQDISINLTHMT